MLHFLSVSAKPQNPSFIQDRIKAMRPEECGYNYFHVVFIDTIMNFRQFVERSEFRFEGATVGILTAHNPQGEPLEPEANEKRNAALWNDLRASGFDPWPIEGSFAGNKEQSFLIPNISKMDIIKLAQRYDQKAAIWARKLDSGYEVEWIEDGATRRKENVKSIRSLVARSKHPHAVA